MTISEQAGPEDFLLPGETNLLAVITRTSQGLLGSNIIAVFDMPDAVRRFRDRTLREAQQFWAEVEEWEWVLALDDMGYD